MNIPQTKNRQLISGTAAGRAFSVIPIPETGEYLAGVGWKDEQGNKHIVTIPANTPGGAIRLIGWLLKQSTIK